MLFSKRLSMRGSQTPLSGRRSRWRWTTPSGDSKCSRRSTDGLRTLNLCSPCSAPSLGVKQRQVAPSIGREVMTTPTVVIGGYKVASFPEIGGHFWVYLQYALGLRQLGCDVHWLEPFRTNAHAEH